MQIFYLDPNAYTMVQEKESVYDGMRLKGAIQKVYVRGQLVVENGKVHPITGEYIRR